jgi:hypothetical protein
VGMYAWEEKEIDTKIKCNREREIKRRMIEKER